MISLLVTILSKLICIKSGTGGSNYTERKWQVNFGSVCERDEPQLAKCKDPDKPHTRMHTHAHTHTHTHMDADTHSRCDSHKHNIVIDLVRAEHLASNDGKH